MRCILKNSLLFVTLVAATLATGTLWAKNGQSHASSRNATSIASGGNWMAKNKTIGQTVVQQEKKTSPMFNAKKGTAILPPFNGAGGGTGLGTGGTVMPPGKPPKPPIHKPPFDKAPVTGVLDPGTVLPPVKPPFKPPVDGVKPPKGGGVLDPGTVKPPVKPPTNPPTTPPTCPPKGGCKDKCHDHYCGPWIGFGGFGGGCYNGGCYSGGVVEVPVIVEQPVVVAQTSAQIAVEPALPQVPAGATITLHGQNFGAQSGRVGLAAGQLMLSVNVVRWSDDAVTVTLPQLGLAGATQAKFVVVRADGSLASEINFELVAAAATQNAISQQ